MSSLTRDKRSPFWICCYTASDGRQLKRSTKLPDRSQALKVCQTWQEAEDALRGGSPSERQTLNVLKSAVERSIGTERYQKFTVSGWADQWIRHEQGTCSEQVLQRFKGSVKIFLEYLGARSNELVMLITREDLSGFRDHLIRSGRSSRTVNAILKKRIGRMFRSAVQSGYCISNPVDAVKGVRAEYSSKRVFTPEELRAILNVANTDWKGMVLFAYHTGARLGDCASFTWRMINADTLVYFPLKTRWLNRPPLQVPLHPELLEWLANAPGLHGGALFKSLHQIPLEGNQGLSKRFMKLMDQAGVDPGYREAKEGGSGRRIPSLSFHSLRHTFNSNLANLGVSQSIRMKLVGHSGTAVNESYTHMEEQVIRQAIHTRPNLIP